MGEFRRQPSKVWWSTYEDEDLSRYSGFLDWGKSVDLSANFTEGFKNNLSETKNNLNSSKVEKSETFAESNSIKSEASKTENVEENEREADRKSLENDRGSSSSPSQGSHKSQDSGFSDSEIQNNGLSLSPECSPEISSRVSCVKCKSREESSTEQVEISQKEKSYNETVANYRKLKTSVKTTAPQYKVVEFNSDNQKSEEKHFLETDFNGYDECAKNETKDGFQGKTGSSGFKLSSPKHKNHKSILKSHILRTKCETREKINHIQNQLELSFKLPKKINLPQNLKISNVFHAKPLIEVKSSKVSADRAIKSTPNSTENLTSFKSLSCVQIPPKKIPLTNLDNEGFKVPKLPSEHSFHCKGSSQLLDFTDIEGPPISSSTPKSNKFQGRESPVPKTARATEKISTAKTTFATVRKLKGLSEKKLKGSKILLESFNRCASAESFPNQPKVNVDSESSVKHWVSELETMYEAEVMTTLQSKSLATDLTREVTNMADATSNTVKKLHQKTKIISLEFSKLCKQNKNKIEKNVGPLVQSLVGHIKEFLSEYVQKPNAVAFNDQRSEQKNQRSDSVEKEEKESETSHEMITDFRKPEPETVEMKKGTGKKTKEEQVLEACENLRRLSTVTEYDHEKIENQVSQLGQKFREVVDGLLENHIQALVRVLEEPRTELALRTALSVLTTLGLEGNQLGEMVSRCGGIRALLAICLEARATAVRVSALRALATVCCVSDTIRQFEQAGGVEIIADILADDRRSEIELSEASAVIAQITAPWVQDNHSVDGLSQFLNSLVTSLTRIVNTYKSCETLLLSSAALANLTFMEPRTVWPLLENETAKILLAAVRRQGSKVSVFIQEQAATIIANMSSVPECRKHLAEQRAVVALLCFLEIHHSPLQSAPEVAAAERVLQKSAIALSRLCSDVIVAKQVVELKGVNRLVRLCKEEKERNHSDGVLVACLAALRKIAANCGTEALKELNAMELVEPRLLDSFLLYSSKQESYV